MFSREFITSKLGTAAMVSVSAMMAFNIIALSQQLQAQPVVPLAVATHSVELA